MRNSDIEQFSDETLVELTRAGKSDAYGELWRRHSVSVTVVARSYTQFDPDDIMQEAFTRVYEQILAGGGPTAAFRAYLGVTARNIATNLSKKRTNSEVTGSEAIFEEQVSPTPSPEEFVLNNAVILTAFESLPARWQEVLWYRDVEDLPISECASYIGLSENSTSVLLKRAREGFKQAWIATNLETGKHLSEDCKWIIQNLPKHTRGKLAVGGIGRVRAHLEICPHCSAVAEETSLLQKRLALVILPAMFGESGALGYIAWVRSRENQVAMFQPGSANVGPSRYFSRSRATLAALTVAAIVTTTVVSVGSLKSGPNEDLAPEPVPVTPPRVTARGRTGQKVAIN